MPGQATLTFTVNTFKSLASGQGLMTSGAGSSADVNVSLSPSSGTDVSVAADGSVTVSGNGAQVINLQAVQAGTRTYYNPVGLVFKQTLGSSDPSGGNAFGSYSRGGGNNANQLQVTDTPGGSATWEFYFLIQNASTGDFGLIDPKITNQP
jgi:hypothetical protein